MGLFTDAARFRQLGTGAMFLLGGALFLLGMVATQWEEKNDFRSYLDSLAKNPARSQGAALLLHFSGICLAAGLFGAVGLVKGRGVALAHVALVLGVLGVTTMPGFLIIDFYDLAIAETLPRDQGVAVEERVDTYPGLILLALPAFLGTIFGLVFAVLAMWRAGFVPLWTPILVFAGYLVSEGSRGLSLPPILTAVVSACILLVAYSYVGIRILRLSRTEWVTGEPSQEGAATLVPAVSEPEGSA